MNHMIEKKKLGMNVTISESFVQARIPEMFYDFFFQ